MTKQELKKEWQRNSFEINQRPKIEGPYSKGVVNLRGWLIAAQVLLGKIGTKSYDGWILEIGYNGLMKMYEQEKRRLVAYF